MLASATGASASVRRLSIAAATKKSVVAVSVNIQTNFLDSRPAGSARMRVRGFAASNVWSASRLKAIAVERAPTIATVIQSSCQAAGIPRAASTAPKKAKGSAKSVCSILIISSVVRISRVASCSLAAIGKCFVNVRAVVINERQTHNDKANRRPAQNGWKERGGAVGRLQFAISNASRVADCQLISNLIFFDHDGRVVGLPAAPLCGLRVRDAELIEDAEDEMIDEFKDCLRAMIETGAGGQDARARVREAQHVLQVERVVRRLARHEDGLASLFQGHVGPAMNGIRACAPRNRSERSH